SRYKCQQLWHLYHHTDVMLQKTLISLIVITLCLPTVTLLLLGIIFSPAILLGVVSGNVGQLNALLLVIGGVWGMYALIYLYLQTLFFQHDDFEIPRMGLTAGTLCCLYPLFYLSITD